MMYCMATLKNLWAVYGAFYIKWEGGLLPYLPQWFYWSQRNNIDNFNWQIKIRQIYYFFLGSLYKITLQAIDNEFVLDFQMDEEIKVKVEENVVSNPWSVENAAAFLKYCCPECDFQVLNLKMFSNHALENHARSMALFDKDFIQDEHFALFKKSRSL